MQNGHAFWKKIPATAGHFFRPSGDIVFSPPSFFFRKNPLFRGGGKTLWYPRMYVSSEMYTSGTLTIQTTHLLTILLVSCVTVSHVTYILPVTRVFLVSRETEAGVRCEPGFTDFLFQAHRNFVSFNLFKIQRIRIYSKYVKKKLELVAVIRCLIVKVISYSLHAKLKLQF